MGTIWTLLLMLRWRASAMADTDAPLVPVVARLYVQSGYRRASTKPGPGAQLVQLIDAQAAIGTWQQRAVARQSAFE